MRTLGSTNHGEEFSGYPTDQKSIRVFRIDPATRERVEPPEFELLLADSDPRLGEFWRWDGLDTAEKREAAIVEWVARPREASIFDRATGGKK